MGFTAEGRSGTVRRYAVGGIEKAVILEEMQRWYNADHTESLQAEFVTLINEWDRSQVLSAAI